MLSPWSPPAYMKTTAERNQGGKLLPQYRERWARYLCRYILEYQKHGLQDVVVLVWDHNKERLLERLEAVCADPQTNAYVGSGAFHWYTGDHFEALELVRRRFPEKKLFFTEGCVEYSRFPRDQKASAYMYAHDIIGNLNGGAHVSIDWNIVLDHLGGPNHVHNYCDAPVMCNIAAGEAKEQMSLKYLEHFSRYILPGAVRIGFTRYTDRLEMTAFKNPDGSYAAVICNAGSEPLPAVLRFQGRALKLIFPQESLSTLIW